MLILRGSGGFTPTYINVKDKGAKGDNVTNDRQAFIDAVNAAGVGGSIYVPKGDYYLNGAINTAAGRAEINLLAGQTLFGDGNYSVLRTSTNTKIVANHNHAVTVASDYNKIHSLKFKGSGKNAGLTFQTGVALLLGNFFDVYNCTFEDLSGSPTQNGGGGIYIGSIATANSHGGRIGLNYYKNCNGGLCFGQRGEYVTVVGGTAGGCNSGLVIGAGNVYVNGFVAEECGIGYDIISGTNDGHGSIIGGSANHNTTYNIRVKDVEQGFTFSAIQSYQGKIVIDNTVGVKFLGCDIVGDGSPALTFDLINNSTVLIANSRYPKTPTGPYITTTVQAGSTLTEADNIAF